MSRLLPAWLNLHAAATPAAPYVSVSYPNRDSMVGRWSRHDGEDMTVTRCDIYHSRSHDSITHPLLQRLQCSSQQPS